MRKIVSALSVLGCLTLCAACSETGNRAAAPIPLAESVADAAPPANDGVGALTPPDKEVPFPALPKGASEIDKKAPKTFTKTASGLRYRILRKGTGKMPKATDKVEVNYHGWVNSGKVFDSSYKRGESISFPLNRVIKGWTEGMQLVGEGGMIELEIPSDLGYGEQGAGADIPPGATLHFLVELLQVK